MAADRRAAAGLLLLIAAASPPAPPPPEPPGLWPGAMEGAVPATLRGATVLPTPAAAKAWIAAQHPVIIDVAPAPKKPPAMAAGMPWLPAAHQDIYGSTWLPDAGRAVLHADRAAAYIHKAATLAGPPPGRPILLYCHPNCWASWNAAKVLVGVGYRHVGWFPGGIEGWVAAGYDLQRTQPDSY
jgi:PQQ-dependent catabolism-associated CXXCW motif protein